ncbi:HK97 gp10 family phage protein [Acinetobacter sp. ANC 3789]|uniref:HK97-gp10 family putative phage morphogenesis protein n=1 Tax=Acinetobacter sp. ANC 3789 TaxID=1217714 RepID=UPI0002CDFD17|nr:HK97-gp10 family putative phage morphogenesis protein [Acinetobacter sp. ANC 3789]ENU80014.1 HK97 gp10 family phage protein [Acinetobacter sp. ANC 3789]
MAEQYIHGLGEVEAKLAMLSNGKAAKNAAKRATRKAMAVVRKAAISNSKLVDDPRTTERIWKNITIRAGRISGENVMMRVGIRGGARYYVKSKANIRKGLAGKTYKTDGDKANPGGDTFYWRFIEFGRGDVIAKNKTKVLTNGVDFFGKKVESAAARPFMRPALQNNISNVTNDFAAVFSAEIDKELAKL